MYKFQKAIVLFFTFLICTWFFYTHGRHAYTFYGDACGYYTYLPSAFLYHNFSAIDSLPKNKNIDRPVLEYVRTVNEGVQKSKKGYFINQYTYGVAALELPFFAIAHCHALVSARYNANGYDTIYHYWLKAGNIIYALLGLFFVFLSLQKIVSEWIALLTACLLLLGSNFFWFALLQAGMAHIPLFLLFSILIYYTIILHENPKPKYFFLVAFAAGFITVIRPTDIICLLIPLLYNIYNLQSVRTKKMFITTHYKVILVSILFFLIPILPQLIFWKIYTGQFFYYSYTTNGFNWRHPEILKGLFGFSNGWLAYSPIFFISIVGLFFISKLEKFYLSISIILPIYIYVIYAWFCYTYINGFGSRPMIHLYPLLAIPFSICIAYFFRKGIFYKIGLLLFIFFAVFYNIKLSWMQAEGKLVSEVSNFAFVSQIVFKKNITNKDLVALDCGIVQPNKNKMHLIKVLKSLSFSDSLNDYKNIGLEEFPNDYILDSSILPASKHQLWYRCSGEFNCINPAQVYQNQLLVFDINGNNKCKDWRSIKINNKVGLRNGKNLLDTIRIVNYHLKQWDEVEMFIPIKANCNIRNIVKLSIWNIPKQELKVKNIKLELWEELN
jgi:hypothetical protein